MERATTAFWLLVAVLIGASVFYGTEVWRFRAQAKDATLASGDVVQLQSVVDGDTLIVTKEGQGNATVRLLGIKTFDAKLAKDDAAFHGRAAEEAVKRLAGEQPLRVLLNNPPKDRHGRTLASLYAGGDDIGYLLVARGHALAYTEFPFANLQTYLQAQRTAREQRLGLWADNAMAERADALAREWSKAKP